MKKKSKFGLRLRSYFVPGVLLLFCLGSFLFLIFPMFSQIHQLFDSINELKINVEKLQGKMAILQNLDEPTLESHLNLLSTLVPIKKDFPTIINTMEGLTRETGLSIEGLTLDDAANLSTMAAEQVNSGNVPLSIQLNGTRDQLLAFLHASLKVRRVVDVRNFSVTISPDNSAKVQMVLNAYFAPLVNNPTIDEIEPIDSTESDVLATLEQYTDYTQPIVDPNAPPGPPLEVGKTNPFSL